jgi:FSR family fosmidomycin resistance protein-like MFS transporter
MELGVSGISVGVLKSRTNQTVYAILAAICFCHFLNDMTQSMLSACYPIFKDLYHLDYAKVGLITLSYQLVASLLQPLVGLYTDRRPWPFSLPVGMGFTLVGLVLISRAHSFHMILFSGGLVGVGSAIFHPESARVARMASGGQHGLAQSFFQVGGNTGSAIGPLLAAFLVLPRGPHSIAWFSIAVLIAIMVLIYVGGWYQSHHSTKAASLGKAQAMQSPLPPRKTLLAILILLSLLFSKFFYLSSISSYYIFYLISKFHLSVQNAQIHLFVFLGAVALGTFAGGPIGDRIGRKYVIWFSILGVFPFTLALPYANLFWTGILTVCIGLILASAFAAIIVFAQELLPGRIGMISGLFLGFAFGMGGVGAAVLGRLADLYSIGFVYHVCSFLPLIGLLTAFLPNLRNVAIESTAKVAAAEESAI